MYAGTYDNDATCTNSQRKDDVTVRDDATSENCSSKLTDGETTMLWSSCRIGPDESGQWQLIV